MSGITGVDTAGGQLRRGAAVLLEVLRSEGVDYIFGNPGTTELPLIDALLEIPDVHYVLGLQEASVVAMADGYAQAARKPGFLNLHTAGGLGHGLGNLLNASVSQTPLVVTAGQQDSRHTISDRYCSGIWCRLPAPPLNGRRKSPMRTSCPCYCAAPSMIPRQPPPGLCSSRSPWTSWKS